MGGERERAELAAFEALLSKCIKDALVAEVRKEVDAHGVDVLVWLTRDKGTNEYPRMRISGTREAKTLSRSIYCPRPPDGQEHWLPRSFGGFGEARF